MDNITKKTPSAMTSRHTLEREPPLPIYIGMNVHTLTRSKKLIHQLFQVGLSISYDRIRETEDWIATSACERFEDDGVVVPSCLSKGLFTVGALDNLDHNPSSTTSVQQHLLHHFMGLASAYSSCQLKPTLVREDHPSQYPLLESEEPLFPTVTQLSQL